MMKMSILTEMSMMDGMINTKAYKFWVCWKFEGGISDERT